MRLAEEFEEITLPVYSPSPKARPSQKSSTHRLMSETVSSSNCTIDLDRNHSKSMLKFHTTPRCSSGFSFNEVADRLISKQQITENKIKFQRIELELKELQECTFRPKINGKGKKSSLSYFSKKQLDYAKSRNTSLLKLKLEQLGKNEVCKGSKKDAKPGIHFRLYHESKLMTRQLKNRY
jgi:hypothetical protein